MKALPSRLWIACILSGAGSLGAQVTWAKQFALALGHESSSVLAVLTAVMAGFAIGAFLWPALSRKISAPQAYARLEAGLGIWVILTGWILFPVASWVTQHSPPETSTLWQGIVGFVVPTLLLFPATFSMGATLPAMVQIAKEAQNGSDSFSISRIYAWNTAGAAVGAFAAPYWVLPFTGLPFGLAGFGILNLICASLFWNLRSHPHPTSASIRKSGRASSGSTPQEKIPNQPHPGKNPIQESRLLRILFFTGLLGIGIEILGIRGLSQSFENTVYSFATALTVFLLATASGAALYRFIYRSSNTSPSNRVTTSLAWMIVSVTITGWTLSVSHSFYAWMNEHAASYAGAAGFAEMGVAWLVFGFPGLGMGILFSALLEAAQQSGGRIQVAIGINYLGGACAALVFGIGIIPHLGFRGTLACIGIIYILLTLPSLRLSSLVAGSSLLTLALLPGDLKLIDVRPNQQLIAFKEGPMGIASIVSDAQGHRTLRMNNRFQMGGTSAVLAQRRQAHIPLLLHPHPEHALFLGPGTGITLGAATAHPALQIEGVELVPEILALMDRFEPENRAPQRNPRVHLTAADARRFVQSTAQRYDVIVADLFHPAQDGSGSLYTQEHFQAIRNRLQAGGLFCQWLPLHQLDPSTLQTITATFMDVFHHTEAWLLHFNVDIPVVALIGRLEAPPTDWPSRIQQRMKDLDPSELRESGFANEIQFLGCRLGGASPVQAWTRSVPLNTDTFPRVAFQAPRASRSESGGPYASLQLFIKLYQTPNNNDSPLMQSAVLTEFRAARDAYLTGLIEESGQDLKQAIERYYQSVQTSLYFTPAYARLINIIQVMAQADPSKAKAMYQRLQEVRPDQPLGKRILGSLFDDPAPGKTPDRPPP